MDELERVFAQELAQINKDRAAAGKGPLDANSQAELRADIQNGMNATDNFMGTVGSAIGGAVKGLAKGVAKPVAKIANTFGVLPKFAQPLMMNEPEGSMPAAMENVGSFMGENKLMGMGAKALRMIPTVAKVLKAGHGAENVLARAGTNAAESAVLPAGLTALEGGSTEDVGKAAGAGAAVGGAVPLAARAVRAPLNWLTRSEYSYDPTNPAQMRAMSTIDDEIAAGGMLGNGPAKVAERTAPKLAQAKANSETTFKELGGPTPASAIDDLGNAIIDERFGTMGAKPPSAGGVPIRMKRHGKALASFKDMLGQIDASIMPKFPYKSGTPGPFLPGEEAAAYKGKIPRENMLMSPTSLNDLSLEAKRLRDTEMIPAQKTAIAAPKHSELMRTNMAYGAAEDLRKGMKTILIQSAATPAEQQAIESAFDNYSAAIEANNLAQKAANPGVTKGGSTLSGPGYRQAIAGSSLAAAIQAAKAGRGDIATKLFAFAAATGAPRATGMFMKNTLNMAGQPKNAGMVPMLLQRMKGNDEYDEFQPR